MVHPHSFCTYDTHRTSRIPPEWYSLIPTSYLLQCTCILAVLVQTSVHLMLASSHATYDMARLCSHVAYNSDTLRLGQAQSVHEVNLLHIRTSLHAGARVALCELPFSLVQTDTEGGLGGTCILRGCVPKKLLVYGGEFANEFKECEGYGYACCIVVLLYTLMFTMYSKRYSCAMHAAS